MLRYRVKFPWGNKTKYGIVENYHPESKQAAKEGCVIVADAVTPDVYKVHESDLTDIPHGKWDPSNPDEYDKYVQDAFDAAQKLNDRVCEETPEGEVAKGMMFSIGVGDGAAYYVVTKVHKVNCQVEWRGFCMDRWTDHHFGWGGKFPVDDVARYVGFNRGMRKLFGSKKA